MSILTQLNKEDAKKKNYAIRFCSNRCRIGFYGSSSLEKTIAHLLDDMKIMYETQYRIEKKRYFYDFYLSDLNLLIEADGTFYHHSQWAIKRGALRRDREKDKLALDSGFRLLRLREERIKDDLAGIERELLTLQSYQKMLEWT